MRGVVTGTDAWACAYCDATGVDDGTSRPLGEHYDAVHNPRTRRAPAIPDVNCWRTAAIHAIQARTGTWQMWEILTVVGDPPDHQHTAGKFARELEAIGVAHVVGYAPSNRPGTKRSAVAVWRTGPKPKENAA